MISIWLSSREEDTWTRWQMYPEVVSYRGCLNIFFSLLFYTLLVVSIFSDSHVIAETKKNNESMWGRGVSVWKGKCPCYGLEKFFQECLEKVAVFLAWVSLEGRNNMFLPCCEHWTCVCFKSSRLPYSTPSSCWKTQFSRRLNALRCPADLVTKNKCRVVNCWWCQEQLRKGKG